MHDIENFCCLERDSLVFALDAIFKLSDMWVTYTSLRNKRLRNPVSGKHPIFLSLVMIYFTKDKATFGRFVLELVTWSSNLRAFKEIVVDLESAIFELFESIIPSLNCLVCRQHLM